jgi:hypothetical protein
MSRCEKEHEKCRLIVEQSGETAGFVPTRLIYVGSDVPADSPILFESSERSEHDPTPPPFTALSHCWGKTQIITTTKRTVALRRAGIPWSALSKTFQDAIELTRALGIDYIWIDSLCIIQDDVEDWAREATKMASIYRNAYLTIGATAAADGSHGLYPRERPIIHSIQATKNDTSFPIYIWRLPDAPDINNSWTVASEDCPLQLRAWTFQEQLLSPRFVHFTREEVVWECYETATCECDRIENVKWPDHHMFKAEVLRVDHGITPGRPGATWNSLVQGYTTRKITYDHDRLPAVSSLATAFDSSGGQYLAGLWRNELPAGLLWQAKKDGPGRPSRHSTNPASSPPSWTWASIDGVRVDHDTTPLRSDVEIIEAEVYPSTSDPRGTVTGGYITLRGHLLKLQSTWERVDYKNFWLEHLVRISSDIRDDEDDKSTSCAGYLDRVTDKKLGFNEGALAGTIFFFLLGNVGGSEGAQPGKGLFLRELVDPTSEQVETGRRTMSKMLVERIGSAEIRESWRQKMYQSDAQIITIF